MAFGQNTSLGKRVRLGLAVFAIALTGACSATYDLHGYVPLEEDLAAITPGIDTRDTIEDTIGQPSAAGVMRDEAWFYSAYRVRNFAYRAPEIIERDVVAISFEEDGTVRNIERFALEDGQVVQLSRRVTENSIREVTFLSQLLRNFGRINIGQELSNR